MALTIALAGNPNCGKTTMFNALTGSNQYVGNWPGVTVEKKEGKLKKGGEDVTITDLPGIYSLSPYTLEEVVSRDYLLKEKPDVIINLVDATNIERNLYLTTQLIETGIPVVIALNMADLLKKNKIEIQTSKLAKKLGCPVVETSALRGTGLDEAVQTAMRTAENGKRTEIRNIYAKDVEEVLTGIEEMLPASIGQSNRRWYAVKLFERDSKVLEQLTLGASEKKQLEELTAALEKDKDDDAESIITDERYTYIQNVISSCVKKPKEKMTTSDKIDRIVTNRILGLPIFLVVMFLVYYISVSARGFGTMGTDWVNETLFVGIQEWAADGLAAIGTNEVLISLIVDGIIGGLGAVLGFLPQMAVLFLFLSILEDCGYMVRIAFVMDRIFRRFGLSGKSFIPMLISSGCGIPGIMASKTIENDNDRRLTIMTATFIPCGAKLPVIALMGGIMYGWTTGDYSNAGAMTFFMYLIGIAAVLVSAIMLKKTRPFSGDPAPFVMELPQYHIPSPRTVLMHTWERLKGFIVKAGTILFVACVIMWFLSGFGFADGSFGLVDSEQSLLAVIGGVIAPIFAPLGFGKWQTVAASLAGFSAKEAIVTTMGVLANVSEEMSEDTITVAAAVKTWFPSALAAFSFLMFNLLDSPCLAAISTMAQQMQDRKWFWFSVIYQNVFAYVVCLIVYQLGGFFMGGTFGVGTCIAFALLLVLLYMLFRPDPYKNRKQAAKRSVTAA